MTDRNEDARDDGDGGEKPAKKDAGGASGTEFRQGSFDSDDGVGGSRVGAGSGAFVGEAIKKLFTAGVSAAFMTEESLRSMVSELRLPKETLNLLLTGAAKSKEELMARAGRELTNVISKINVVEELTKFAEEHKFKINAEVEFIKKDKKSE